MSKNVPKLRFKEFSDEWKTSSLKEICKINPKTKELPDEFNYIDLESIVNGVIIKEKVIELKNAPSRAQRLLSEGDVLFQTVRPYQMNNFLFENCSYKVSVASTGYAQLRSNFKSYNKFIYQLIHNKKFNNKVMLRCTGTSYPAINSSELASIPIKIPSLQEQKKIADFFTILDSLIEEQEGKVRDLKIYKKGMMQKIFKQEIRFKDDNGLDYPEWEEKKILEIFAITRGQVIAKTSISPIKTDKSIYPVYSSQTSNYGILGYDSSYDFDGEFLTWTTDGANAGKVFKRNGKFRCTNVCGLLVEKDITKGFANVCIKEILEKETPKHVSYVGNPKLMNGVMGDIKIKIPCLEEQTKIANFLSNIDSLIEEEQKNLDDLREMKKGLLQQMFV